MGGSLKFPVVEPLCVILTETVIDPVCLFNIDSKPIYDLN